MASDDNIETTSMVPTDIKIVQDPRTAMYAGQPLPDYLVEKSNSDFTIRQYSVSGSVSSNSMRFNIRTPSADSIIYRDVYVEVPLELRITYSGPPNADKFYADSACALRHMPLQNALFQNVQLTINSSQPISREYNRIFDPMSRYMDMSRRKDRFSLAPFYPDVASSYAESHLAINNPLGPYDNAVAGAPAPRGSFQLDSAARIAGTNDLLVRVTVREPLTLMSPFDSDAVEQHGLFGITDLDVAFTFSSGSEIARVISVDAANIAGPAYTSVAVTPLGGAQMTLFTASPLCNQQLPERMVYPYKHIEHYTTSAGAPLASGATTSISTNSQTLSSVPTGFYVFASKAVGDRDETDPDFYCRIQRLSIDIGNRTGLLNNSTERDLYTLSEKNGYKGTFQQWTRNGSVCFISLENGDVGLGSSPYLPGMSESILLKVRADILNQSGQTFTPELHLIPVYSGIMSITREGAVSLSSVVVDNEAALAMPSEYSPEFAAIMSDRRGMYGGSGFLSKLKSGAKSAVKYLDSAKGRRLGKDLGDLASYIPGGREVSDIVGDFASPTLKLARKLVGSGICTCEQDAMRMLRGYGVLGAGSAGRLSEEQAEEVLRQIRVAHGLTPTGRVSKKKGGAKVTKSKLAHRLI